MAALIGALRVSLSADTAAFHKGMQRAERQARTSGNAISKSLGNIKAGFAGLAAGIGVGLLAGLTAAVKSSLEYAGSLGEIAQQLGVTTRQLQVYRYAASQVGVSQQEMDKGLEKLNITLGKAKLGAKGPTEAFAVLSKAIGKDIVASSAQAGDALPLVSEALSKITDRSKRAAIEVILFSKTGSKLDTVLSGGKAALDAYAKSLEEMGGILSDEEIQSADLTADKIEQLNTALKANIAGAVARNSNAILQLAESLVYLISKIGQAITHWNDLQGVWGAKVFQRAADNPFLSNEKRAEARRRVAIARGTISDSGVKAGVAGNSVTIKLKPITKPKEPVAPGFDPGKLLAGGGGSKKTPKGPKDNTARDTFEFEQEMRRTQIEVLRAQQDLATDYVDRHRIALDILKLERAAYEHELAYAVASGDITKARADQLLAEDAKLLKLKQDKVLQDEEFERRRDYNELAQVDFDIQKEGLETQAQLAETASERRDIELRLLDLAARQERARLEAVIADEESGHLAQEEARRRLAKLDELTASRQQGVINSTRGPWESFMAGVPDSAAKMQEALEQVKVNGVDALTDGLVDAAMGVRSLGEVFKTVASQIIADLLRIQIQKMIVGLIGGVTGGASGAFGLPAGGFAAGGFTGMGGRNKFAGMVHGQEFVLNADATRRLGVPNLNALNSGAPMAAVSNDNSISGRGGEVHIHMSGPMTDREARATGRQAAVGYRQATASSVKAGF